MVPDKNEERRSLEAVALPLARQLYAVALRLTGRPADAEDVVQETMMYEEAAEVLDVPQGTISSRLYRARKQLFELLTPHARKLGFLEG